MTATTGGLVVRSTEEDPARPKRHCMVIILLCPPCKKGVGQSVQKPPSVQSKARAICYAINAQAIHHASCSNAIHYAINSKAIH